MRCSCMNHALIAASLAIGLLLSACDKHDPVDGNVVAPPDELAGDMSAEGLAAPANAAAAEAAAQAALPPASGGLGWTFRAEDRTALFGPPGTPAFSIQCNRSREGANQLLFVRHLPPTSGTQATLSFTGNGHAASAPIAAVTNPDGIGGQWRGVVSPGDTARAIARTFSGPGAVEVSITGLAPLVVPASPAPRRVMAECVG